MKTRSLHYFGGVFLFVFVSLHLINHAASLWGSESHIALMATLRHFYRHPVLEALLGMALISQGISGIRLWRNLRGTTMEFFQRMQVWSGLYLLFFLVIHTSAVLGGRWLLGLDTNFYFGVAGINTFPLNLFFIPYYGLAVMSFFAHLAGIHYKKMKTPLLGLPVEAQSWGILLVGIVITGLLFAGFTDYFSGIDIPTPYQLPPKI
ncbi:MAG: hypothetical protein MUF42_01395 [Cytophagaceae bacterium]|jgi:hypothetical protein|nr:hypothetical protein [Cytophagaceae bacterium]